MADLETKTIFTIQPVQDKGKGVIALSKITQAPKRITRSATRLLLPQQHLWQDPSDPAWNRYGSGGEGGVFLTGSQFNHDCLPSARSKWNIELNKMTVHTLRDIEHDEEITTNYINLETWDVRQRMLWDSFLFTCNCEICKHPPDIRKLLDTDIMEIKERVLVESNGLEKAHVPATYDFASKLAAVHKDYVRAKFFSERQLDILMTEGGPDHPDTRQQQDMDTYLESVLPKHLGPAVPHHFPIPKLENWLWMNHLPEVQGGESSEDGEQGAAEGNSTDSSSDGGARLGSKDEGGKMVFGVEALG
ncbi:hypothetical protein PG994_008348 [Apiospora phragmitis]|uniref:SET domain-containing protein n=1 Tax=Apiospora phragmitis TaxID=2905665 RepID=A0ABR1USR3_9PEZI